MKFMLQTFFKGLYYFLRDNNFRSFVWLCIRFGNSKRYAQKEIKVSGLKFKVPDAKSFIWQFYEIGFKGYYDFRTEMKSPVIIDCGSNVGLSVVHFKQQHPDAQIHAFEADAQICAILKDNILNNGYSDITVYNEAVWTKDEMLNFTSEGADGGQISGASENSNQINGIDLKRFMNRFDKIAFLKIDIEGAEVALLPHIASELHKVEHLFVEFHSYNNQTQGLREVMDAITSAGHRVYIDNATFKNQPFLNKSGKYGMDLQLNIFAYKN